MTRIPSISEPTSQIRLACQQECGQLQQFESLREGLQRTVTLLTSYLTVLDRNESIAKHLNIPLFSTRMDARISDLFSSSHPSIVEPADMDGHCESTPSWPDLVREANPIDQFEPFENNTYRCYLRGVQVEISKSDYDVLSSGVLQKLLQGPADPEDVEKERAARNQLASDLTQLQEDIVAANEKTQRVLHFLQEKSHTDISSTRSESLVPSAEIPSYDAATSMRSTPQTHSGVDVEQSSVQWRTDVRDDGVVGPSVSNDDNFQSETRPSAWTPSERVQFRAFLSTREHLSWSRIAREYEQLYHMGRSSSSLASQARQMGLHVGRKSRKRRARSAQREPLVLKVRFPPSESKTSSGDLRNSADPYQPLSEMSSTCAIAGNSAHTLHSNGVAQSSMSKVPPLHGVSRDVTNEVRTRIQCPENDPAGRFNWILN